MIFKVIGNLFYLCLGFVTQLNVMTVRFLFFIKTLKNRELKFLIRIVVTALIFFILLLICYLLQKHYLFKSFLSSSINVYSDGWYSGDLNRKILNNFFFNELHSAVNLNSFVMPSWDDEFTDEPDVRETLLNYYYWEQHVFTEDILRREREGTLGNDIHIQFYYEVAEEMRIISEELYAELESQGIPRLWDLRRLPEPNPIIALVSLTAIVFLILEVYEYFLL